MTDSWMCSRCDGSGLIWRNAKTFGGKAAVGWQEFCPACNGSGRVEQSLSSADNGQSVEKSLGKPSKANGDKHGKKADKRGNRQGNG